MVFGMRYFIVVITFLGFLFSCSSNKSVKTNGGEEANTEQTADVESQGVETSSENASDSSSSPNSESSSSQEKQSKQTNYDRTTTELTMQMKILSGPIHSFSIQMLRELKTVMASQVISTQTTITTG